MVHFQVFKLGLIVSFMSCILCYKDFSKHKNWKLLDHKNCGSSLADRIIGGTKARLGEKPWLVRIGYSSNNGNYVSYRCGGSILNKKTVLTAAHCVSGLQGRMEVHCVAVGEHNINTDPDCEDGVCAPPVQIVKACKTTVHPQYLRYANDIALIHLEDEIKYNAFVFPICIIRDQLLDKNFVGETLNVAGWGIIDVEKGLTSDVLMKVPLKVVETAICTKFYQSVATVGPNQMCIGGIVGYDSCGGDSGGPITYTADMGRKSQVFAVGVVSFGAKKCGGSELPGVYTRVSSYVEWILDNLEPK